ncbi:hypothetical protein OBBRIDRAFT_813690 [Obba rivulosa]|uniref:Uncharacterized protein n=1 Tax=Obba rivulosa TaxID=1052685 RepID=A0A8E2AQ58_9APHY|nr:hypothetical protein OBBRIDRAFT_813690 [Obba rivulosa]
MRALTIDLDDDLYGRKLSLEAAATRPCIVPGNALHLIDDDPAPRPHTPPSAIVPADPPPPARPAPRVRFRSRVRITSGLHKHRRAASGGTPGSSASDSPSSSISAPLRYQADEHGAWGPLGKRLSAYAGAGWQKRGAAPRHKAERVRGARGHGHGHAGGEGADERTPLVRDARRTAYVDPYGDIREGDEEDDEERAMRAAALRREHDAVFGKWPWRLFNRHWWWWQFEPVLCCCCPDDSDYDE